LLLFLDTLTPDPMVLNVSAKRLSIENSHCCVRSLSCAEHHPKTAGSYPSIVGICDNSVNVPFSF